MSRPTPEQRALRPLWMLTTGVVTGVSAVAMVDTGATPGLCWMLVAMGIAAMAVALHRQAWWWLFFVAGLSAGTGRALQARADQLELDRVFDKERDFRLRIEMTVEEGWSRTRWGWRTRVRPTRAIHRDLTPTLPPRCHLEVRGMHRRDQLPPVGSLVEALVAVRGDAGNPLLVASSPSLVLQIGEAHGIPMIRDWLTSRLIASSGTDLDRIRSAQLGAALALGRRDVMAPERRDGWRRSGLAHMLAVSGLHVGIVASLVWIVSTFCGSRPRTVRIAVLITLPTYALLAGASPSAMRAALMGMIFVLSRLIGRALLPMAAVLLATSGLLLAHPMLLTGVGFQLTVLITAALVRWVPAAVDNLPFPRWLAGVVAVPVVAQVAAAPVVAWHFRTFVPGAAASNLLVPCLLAPTLVACLGATVVAPIWSAGAGLLLDAVGLCERLLWLAGTPGRIEQLVLPSVPPLAIAAMAGSGWLALQAGRHARAGAAAWLLCCLSLMGWWIFQPGPTRPRIDLLPVADGLAAVSIDGSGAVMVDGGRWKDEASQLLADLHLGELTAIVVSHTDEDHTGGLEALIRRLPSGVVVLPSWMQRDPTTVPLMRAARGSHTRIVPVARGSCIRVGSSRLEVLWPPANVGDGPENERSLVVRLRQPDGIFLITSDIGTKTEYRLSRISSLACNVLIAPHHGSRASSSSVMISAADPSLTLIPAGPQNIHGHPHPEVLERYEGRGIPYRYPARDGQCGAILRDGKWELYP